MAFKTTATGVRFTKGRGKSQIAVDISTKEIAAWARRNRAEMPRLMQKVNGSAATTLQKKLRKIMKNGGGVDGVPQFKPLEQITEDIRAIEGTSGQPIGRTLADPQRIVKYKRGQAQIVGWPDSFVKTACAFQDGEGAKPDPFTDPKFRKMLHTRGVYSVPPAYIHNPRDVIRTFCTHASTNLVEWRKNILNKEIAKQLVKQRGIA